MDFSPLALAAADGMFLAGCALMTLILLKRSYRYFGGRSRSQQRPAIERVRRPATKWDGSQRDTLAQIDRQKVEMHEMARDLNGELNTRILVLEQLIHESQQKIDRLEELLGEDRLSNVVQTQ